MLQEVTDPDVLKQLGTPTGNLQEVTDPATLAQLNGTSQPTQDPGLVKSVGAGLMSGVPLAETATAGVESLVHGTPYSQEHQNLEQLKNEAWQQHPIGYAAGKVAGFGATGAVAPEGLPGAIAAGAGFGADTAQDLANAPKAVAEGAAGGAIAGVVGEKLISPALEAIANKIPGLADIAQGLGVKKELAQNYLERPAEVNAAPATQAEVGDQLEGIANNARQAIFHLSDIARSKLDPASSVSYLDEISPIIEELQQKYSTEGIVSGQAQSAAQKAIQQWDDALAQHATANINEPGQISDTTVAQLVRDIRKNTNYNPLNATVESDASDSALKQLSSGLDQIIKTKNQDYATAMEPVSELTNLLDKTGKQFSLKTVGGQIEAGDTTTNKLKSVLNPNKTNAQETLGQFGDITGQDFVQQLQDVATKQALSPGGSDLGVIQRYVLPGLGYGAGHLSGLPYAGFGGLLVGRAAGQMMDSGVTAKLILDSYLNHEEMFEGASQLLNKYGPVLAKAAKQGGNQLAATHFVLGTSNPEYQQLVDHVQGNQ